MKPGTLRRSDVLALVGLLVAAGSGCAGVGLGAGAGAGKRGADVRDATSPPPRTARGAARLDQALEVVSGDAFVRFDPAARAWTLGNGRFEERLELTPAAGGGVHLVRRSLVSRDRQVRLDVREEEDGAAGEDDEGPVYDALGIDIAGDMPELSPLDHRLERLPNDTLYAAIRFRHTDSGAELTKEVRLRPGHPVVEHRASLFYPATQAPRPPATPAPARLRLTRLDAADMVVRSGPNPRWRAATLDIQGNVSFARLGADGQLEAETPAQSAARAPVVPLLVLHDATNEEGLFFALRWSTNYRILARSIGNQRVAVEAGVRMTGNPMVDTPSAVVEPLGFLVHPGQTITGPWVVIGVSDGPMEEAVNVLKAYLVDDRPREPSWAEDVMPVAWNSWFGYGTGVDFDSMLAEARLSRDLGMEVFYVDYGWSVAQGDWVPHPERFPGRTLARLADEVHRMGMRFGLWVAFGVADPDSALLAQHPEFRARQPTPARTGIDGSLPLCLTRAREWVERDLARIVRDYRVDWLKFDQPMVAACLDVSHGHDASVRGSLQANNQAFYEILRGLRLDFPELYVESTFDGAGYLDYGVFAGSHAAWLDDAAGDPSVPLTVVQQSFYGASLAFPARFLTLWLARGPGGEEVPGRGFAPEDLLYQGYSTMGGNWGLSLRLGELDDVQRETVSRLVRDYKQFRQLLPGSHVYHLLPALAAGAAAAPTAAGRQPAVLPGPTVQDWFVLQYVQPESGQGAVLAVRNGGAARRNVRLQGLVPGAAYHLEWSDGRRLDTASGQDLMQFGIPLELAPLSGAILWVRS